MAKADVRTPFVTLRQLLWMLALVGGYYLVRWGYHTPQDDPVTGLLRLAVGFGIGFTGLVLAMREVSRATTYLLDRRDARTAIR